MVRGRKIGRREFLKRGAAAIAGLALPPVRSVRVVPPPTHQDVWKIGVPAYLQVSTVWHVTNWRDGWIEIGGSDA